MLTRFLQRDSKLKLVVELLRKMLGLNNGFVPADDGVHILKKHDPWKYRMGKAGVLGFYVVRAEMSRCVKEFFRNEEGHYAHGVPGKAYRFARCSGSCRPFLQRI